MGKARKILLFVEDNADDSFLFSIAISAQGSFSFKTVPDGQQAINYLEGVGVFADRLKYPLPDIIVLDLKMPNLDGFGFLAWRRSSQFLSVPVVVLEGSGNVDDQRRAQEMGALLTYTKPWGLERLHKIVEEICGLVVLIPQQETPQAERRFVNLPLGRKPPC